MAIHLTSSIINPVVVVGLGTVKNKIVRELRLIVRPILANKRTSWPVGPPKQFLVVLPPPYRSRVGFATNKTVRESRKQTSPNCRSLFDKIGEQSKEALISRN